MGGTFEKISTILVAIVGVAALAVVLSKQANTQGVISSSGNALSGFLGTALSPITGGGGYNNNQFSGLNSFNVY